MGTDIQHSIQFLVNIAHLSDYRQEINMRTHVNRKCAKNAF
jgi:hypothetical protein